MIRLQRHVSKDDCILVMRIIVVSMGLHYHAMRSNAVAMRAASNLPIMSDKPHSIHTLQIVCIRYNEMFGTADLLLILYNRKWQSLNTFYIYYKQQVTKVCFWWPKGCRLNISDRWNFENAAS